VYDFQPFTEQERVVARVAQLMTSWCIPTRPSQCPSRTARDLLKQLQARVKAEACGALCRRRPAVWAWQCHPG